MNVSQIDFNSPNASHDFAESLHQTGFVVTKNHPIDYGLMQEAFKEWEFFFKSDYKEQYLFDEVTQDGFFPTNVSEVAIGAKFRDLKEFYNYYAWGRYPKELSDVTLKLYEQMLSVSDVVINWLNDNLPSEIQSKLSEPLPSMIKDSSQILFRIIHYPPLLGDNTNGAVRSEAHHDSNIFTILAAASSSGLQLQDNEGKWVDIPVDPGMLAINIGDMLQEATGGYYKSTKHRVINPTGEERLKSRFSIPLFVHARPDVRISDRYTQASFLHERLVAHGNRTS